MIGKSKPNRKAAILIEWSKALRKFKKKIWVLILKDMGWPNTQLEETGIG